MRKRTNAELNRKSVADFKAADKTPLILVLDDVRSGHNIGSVFRTADAFLVQKIILCGITATPPNKEIYKTALGSTETVAWEYVPSAADAILSLKADHIKVFAVEQVENAVMLDDFAPNPDSAYALVFGNEVFGVSADAVAACDGSIEIPQVGTKHSLNISVSAGIAVWDFFTKMRQGVAR